MKRVLFVINNMEIGGTRTSLLNLLSFLSKNSDLSIDLLILCHEGPFFNRIPQNVNVLTEQWIIRNSLTGKRKKTVWGKCQHLIVYILKIIFGYKRVYGCIFSKIANKHDKYDVVVGYQEGLSNDCASYIKANRHYFWIHNDYKNWFSKSTYMSDVYDHADGIIFVADAAKEDFCNNHPDLIDKCIIIKNTIDTELIIRKARANCNLKPSQFQIVSIGRVCEQKAYERVIDIAERLKRYGIEFHWMVIGDGEGIEKLRGMVEEHELTQSVCFAGKMENPYPLLAQSKLLAVTSIYESQPMVILEALTLGIPVITTRFSSAQEIINGNNYGYIAKDADDDYSNKLYNIIAEPKIYNEMKCAALRFQYDNEEIVRLVTDLFY